MVGTQRFLPYLEGSLEVKLGLLVVPIDARTYAQVAQACGYTPSPQIDWIDSSRESACRSSRLRKRG